MNLGSQALMITSPIWELRSGIDQLGYAFSGGFFAFLMFDSDPCRASCQLNPGGVFVQGFDQHDE